jgi:hypothetical protein
MKQVESLCSLGNRERKSPFSRRQRVRALHRFTTLLGERAQGRPGARRHPWALARKSRAKARRPQVMAENTPAFPARWLTGLFRALLGEPMLLCHRRRPRCVSNAAYLTPRVWGAGTTRLRRPHLRRSSVSASTSTASRTPRIVTFAIAPLQSRRDAQDNTANQNFGKAKYFFCKGLTGIRGPSPAGQIPRNRQITCDRLQAPISPGRLMRPQL